MTLRAENQHGKGERTLKIVARATCWR